MSSAQSGGDTPVDPQALPFRDLPRVGGLSTMPTRLARLARTIAAILPQLDRLYVFLDGHQTVPASVQHEKIVVLRSQEDGDLHSSGKFLGLTRERLPCVYVTFDDDIIYPADYAETLVDGLARFGGRVVAGFHGTLFTPPYKSFARSQDFRDFSLGLAHDIRVDMLDTGTTAFVSSLLPVDPRAWPDADLDALMLSLAAESREIPRIAIARAARYLQAHAERADASRTRAQHDDRRQTQLMRQLLAAEQKSQLGLPPRR